MFYVPARPKALTEAPGTAWFRKRGRHHGVMKNLLSAICHLSSVIGCWLSAIGYWLFAQRWLFLITGTGGNTIALA